MKTQQSLRQLGILGVVFGLTVSPLASADMHEPAAQEPGTTNQPSDPAMSDPASDPASGDPMAEPGQPAGEPGFGEGTDPMPNGERGETVSDEKQAQGMSDNDPSMSNEPGAADDEEDQDSTW